MGEWECANVELSPGIECTSMLLIWDVDNSKNVMLMNGVQISCCMLIGGLACVRLKTLCHHGELESSEN